MTILACVAWQVSPAGAAPEPSRAGKTWDVDFEFHDPARISVTLPGQAEPTTYWYMLFTVTNNTNREIDFYPAFSLVTDTLQVVEGNDDVDPRVYQELQAQYKKLYPFLVDPTGLYGLLKQGEDNRRTGVIAFRDFDPRGQFVHRVRGRPVRRDRAGLQPGLRSAQGRVR